MLFLMGVLISVDNFCSRKTWVAWWLKMRAFVRNILPVWFEIPEPKAICVWKLDNYCEKQKNYRFLVWTANPANLHNFSRNLSMFLLIFIIFDQFSIILSNFGVLAHFLRFLEKFCKNLSFYAFSEFFVGFYTVFTLFLIDFSRFFDIFRQFYTSLRIFRKFSRLFKLLPKYTIIFLPDD